MDLTFTIIRRLTTRTKKLRSAERRKTALHFLQEGTQLVLFFQGERGHKLHDAVDAFRQDPLKEIKRCFGCHTTASTTSGTFDPEHAFWGVTCEACHGAGSLYAEFKTTHEKFKLAEVQALGSTSPPKVEQCLQCHVKECPTMPADYKFDFEKAKVSKDVHEHIPLKFEH